MNDDKEVDFSREHVIESLLIAVNELERVKRGAEWVLQFGTSANEHKLLMSWCFDIQNAYMGMQTFMDQWNEIIKHPDPSEPVVIPDFDAENFNMPS